MKGRPTSPRKRTKLKGHCVFPGAGECFATRRTSDHPKVREVCVERMIKKCKENGNCGVTIDSMWVAAWNEANTSANASLFEDSFEEILKQGPFILQDKFVFYDGSADSGSNQEQGDPQFQSQGLYPSLPSSRCPAARLPSSSSASGSRPVSAPPRSQRDTHKKSYNGRPIVPELPRASKTPPRPSGSHNTMESIRRRMLSPLSEKISGYILANKGCIGREELIKRVMDDWTVWREEDVERQLRVGSFEDRQGKVYLKR